MWSEEQWRRACSNLPASEIARLVALERRERASARESRGWFVLGSLLGLLAVALVLVSALVMTGVLHVG